jgi:hypothetical protein
MSPELRARLETLKARRGIVVDDIFTPSDAALIEELRADMLAFLHEPSFRLGKKFASTLVALEQLACRYPPLSPAEFAFHVAGCYSDHTHYTTRLPSKDTLYYALLKECSCDIVGGDFYKEIMPDYTKFYKRLSDPRRPICQDWNANFQVGNVLKLFEAFVLVMEDCAWFNDTYESIMYDAPPRRTCGKYLPLLDPDFYVRVILPDLVAPEDQVPWRKYVRCYKDIRKWVENSTYEYEEWHVTNRLLANEYIRGIIAMPFSTLVPSGYGLCMSVIDGHAVIGSFVDES